MIKRQFTVSELKSYAVTEQGKNALQWYPMATEKILSYDAPFVLAAALAATSPRMHVRINAKMGKTLYNCHLSGLALPESGFLRLHIGLFNKFLATGMFPSTAPKVTAFFNNLIGNYDYVTVDTWVLQAYGFTKSLTPKWYSIIADDIKKIAKQLKTTPAQCQALIWCLFRSKNGADKDNNATITDFL